jgi:hypothetical protein
LAPLRRGFPFGGLIWRPILAEFGELFVREAASRALGTWSKGFAPKAAALEHFQKSGIRFSVRKCDQCKKAEVNSVFKETACALALQL